MTESVFSDSSLVAYSAPKIELFGNTKFSTHWISSTKVSNMSKAKLENNETLSLLSLVSVADGHLCCDLRDQKIILNLATGAYFGLDAVGASVWNLLLEPTTVVKVRDAIVTEYAVEPERCKQDLLAFLGQLQANGLVHIHG